MAETLRTDTDFTSGSVQPEGVETQHELTAEDRAFFLELPGGYEILGMQKEDAEAARTNFASGDGDWA